MERCSFVWEVGCVGWGSLDSYRYIEVILSASQRHSILVQASRALVAADSRWSGANMSLTHYMQ